MSNRCDQIAALTPKQAEAYREARESGLGVDDALVIARMSSLVLDTFRTLDTLDYYTRALRGDFHEPNGELK